MTKDSAEEKLIRINCDRAGAIFSKIWGFLPGTSYAPWVRSDLTGFEVASGEMVTFTFPETVAAMARAFWK